MGISDKVLSQRFEDALAYAAGLHVMQLRKGSNVPYVAHLLGTASLVIEGHGNEDQVIAALLHDAVEDQGGFAILQEIKGRFGQRVAAIVEACTDSHTIPKPPWRERKESYIARIPEKPDEAILVMTADKLHNARAIVRDYRQVGEVLWERFTGGREGTIWYYNELVKALKNRETPLYGEFERTVRELNELTENNKNT